MRKFRLETWNMLAKFAKTEGDINARKDDENISLRAITRAKKFCIDKITTSCSDPFIRMSRYYKGLKSISLAFIICISRNSNLVTHINNYGNARFIFKRDVSSVIIIYIDFLARLMYFNEQVVITFMIQMLTHKDCKYFLFKT